MTAALASLIDGISRGSSDDLLRFYDRTSARVFGVIGNLVPDPDQRERVMEDIYLEVWEKAADYDPDEMSPGAWLITLAHQQAVAHSRSGAAPTDVVGLPESAPELDALPALQRKCVELTYYRGMTLSQASTHLGMTEAAATETLTDAVGGLAPARETLPTAG